MATKKPQRYHLSIFALVILHSVNELMFVYWRGKIFIGNILFTLRYVEITVGMKQ